MPWTPPASVESVAIAPLDKGMRLDRPGQALEDGAFVRLENLIVSPIGLFKRPGYASYAGGDSTPYIIEDIVTVWDTTGYRISILITDKVIYEISATGGLTEIAWAYSTGTVTVVGTTVNGLGTLWLSNDIMVGDLLRIGTQEATILSVDTDTGIQLTDADITDCAGVAYTIQRAFGPGNVQLIDSIVVEGDLLFADGKRKLMHYDPDTHAIDYWITSYPATGEFVPGVVATIDDRVWVGNVEDAVDGHTPQRLRWSTLSNNRDFSLATSYLDIPYSDGTIKKVMPLGGSLIVYFADTIYIGSRTSYPLAPIAFDRVETGGVGVPGLHCVCSYLNSHYFVGPDDIYILSAEGITRVGAPILRESIRATQLLHLSYAVADQYNSCMTFAIPGLLAESSNIWRLNLQTQGWSLDQGISTSMLANPTINTSITWPDLAGYTWNNLGAVYPTWDDMYITDSRRFLYLESDGQVWRGTTNSYSDLGANPIAIRMDTKDHTFGDPDSLKVCSRFAIKIDWDTAPNAAIALLIEVSVNKGRTWKTAGTISIPVGSDEGYVNFRSIGSTLRFRITSSTTVNPFYVTEYTMRVRLGGREVDISTQA